MEKIVFSLLVKCCSKWLIFYCQIMYFFLSLAFIFGYPSNANSSIFSQLKPTLSKLKDWVSYIAAGELLLVRVPQKYEYVFVYNL